MYQNYRLESNYKSGHLCISSIFLFLLRKGMEKRRGQKEGKFPSKKGDDVYKCRIKTKRFLPSSRHAHDFRLTSSLSIEQTHHLSLSLSLPKNQLQF